MKSVYGKKTTDFSGIFFSVLLCYFIYSIVESELPRSLSDYNGHLYVYYPLFTKETLLKGWQTVPYFLWHGVVFILEKLFHIPLENAAGYTSCIFALFSYGIIRWTLLKVLKHIDETAAPEKADILAFALSIVQGIYLDWTGTTGRFLGIFSMNPLFNPTQMCVLGISFLCLTLTYDLLCTLENNSHKGIFFPVENGLKKYYILLSALLFLSTLAKPVFAEMFIPATGIFMLEKLIRRLINDKPSCCVYFRHCLHMFLCAAPALLYILLQSLDYFVIGGSYAGETSVIFTECGEVWHLFSENIVLSIALGMAFPLYVFMIHPSFFIQNTLGKLGLTGYLTGLVEALFLAESGTKFAHANFIWPMCSGMALMWLASVIDMLLLEKQTTDSKQRFLLQIGRFLFALHVLCGWLYIKEILG